MTAGLERRGVAVVAVTRQGARLAAEIAATLKPAAELYVAERWRGNLDPGARPIGSSLHSRLADLFPRVEGLVLVLALGATVRLIAPLLADKRNDPAVVVVDDAGRHAVSVLGGHRAGANALAEHVAQAIGAEPVITTASESRGLPALDLLGAEHGWLIEAAPDTLSRVAAAAVNGDPVGVYQDAGERDWVWQTSTEWVRLDGLDQLRAWKAGALVITDRALEGRSGVDPEGWVVYRPKTLVLGIGCSRGVAAEEIEELARATVREAGLSWQSLHSLATIDRRLDEPGLRQFADEQALSLRGFRAEELASLLNMPNPSSQVAQHVGTPGVCEPAAMLASEGGELIVPKRKSARATVAVARRHSPTVDRSRGSLAVIGLGPGPSDSMTARARRALRSADAIVGYRGYVEPLRATLSGKALHLYDLGQEAERVRTAIELARSGQRVALVSSGDAGIYGMAGLVFELLAEEPLPPTPLRDAGRGRPPVEVIPGVTAASAAAALLGAPLMLDFAVLSLSDLLVPWETIERRLRAAVAGDFVVVLYNPASATRRQGLARAQTLLLEQRPPGTPVGIVRDAERPEQSVQIATLGTLLEHLIDMRTIVVVGNSATVRIGDRLVTHRGYRSARTPADERAGSSGDG